MDTSDDYRSYGSYLSRVFAIIVVLILLFLTVWFVVQISTDDNGDVVVENGSTAVLSEEEQAATGIGSSSQTAGSTAPSPEAIVADVSVSSEQGQTLSTNTDDLPDTGPGDIAWLLVVGLLAYAGFSYSESKKLAA